MSLRKQCGRAGCETLINSASAYCEPHRPPYGQHPCPDCGRPISRKADHCLEHRVHGETRPPLDPEVVKARDAVKHRKQVETAKRELPPHQCNYVFDTGVQCIELTGVQRKKNQGWVRSEFCQRHGAAGTRSPEERRRIGGVGGAANAEKLKNDPVYMAERQEIGRQQGLRNLERDPGLVAMRGSTHQSASRRRGPNWRKVRAENISKAKTGRVPTPAERDALKGMRAKKTKTFSGEYMRLIRRREELEAMTALELLKEKYWAVEADAKAYVGSIINGLKGPRPLWDLDELSGYLKARMTVEAITAAIGLRERQVQTAKRLLREADAQRPRLSSGAVQGQNGKVGKVGGAVQA